jgi:hypothetical protein
MGYSCEEISGLDFHELQTKSGSGLGGGGGLLLEDGMIPGYNNSLPQQQQTTCRPDVSPTSGHSNQLSHPQPQQTNIVATTSSPSPHPLSAPPFHDHLLSDITAGKEWEGNYMYNPKTGDPIFLNSKIIPLNLSVGQGNKAPSSSGGGGGGGTFSTNYASSSSQQQQQPQQTDQISNNSGCK